MRKFISDTLAMIIFSTITGMIIELEIVGLTINQSIHARTMAIPINLLTGRLQGIFHDWVFLKLKVQKEKKLQKCIAEIIAFSLFQIPIVNAPILFLAGANISQVFKSGITLMIICIFISKLYDLFLNFFRRIFKVG